VNRCDSVGMKTTANNFTKSRDLHLDNKTKIKTKIKMEVQL
jgi:hypothetical protein